MIKLILIGSQMDLLAATGSGHLLLLLHLYPPPYFDVVICVCIIYRLQMLPGMTVRELSISVQSSDDSYMPSTVVISVGHSVKNMMEIKTIKIPRDTTGSIVLVRTLGQSISLYSDQH